MFTNKLKEDEIFACYATSVVAKYRLEQGQVSRINKVGPVDPNMMNTQLDDAKKLGFNIPIYNPVIEMELAKVTGDKPSVVIIGAELSGLSVAASLSKKQIHYVILEADEDPNTFGSWKQHFTSLEIMIQKKWCNLPGMSMSNQAFLRETVSPVEYQQYLSQYMHRFEINVNRRARVVSIKKGTEMQPYIVKYLTKDGDQDMAAQVVVDAMGKHPIPQKSASSGSASKLDACRISHVHSTQMCDDSTWSQSIQAAQNDTLCIVGFGNAAADLTPNIGSRWQQKIISHEFVQCEYSSKNDALPYGIAFSSQLLCNCTVVWYASSCHRHGIVGIDVGYIFCYFFFVQVRMMRILATLLVIEIQCCLAVKTLCFTAQGKVHNSTISQKQKVLNLDMESSH